MDRKTCKISIFSGHLFCKDCGAKLYYCTANNFTPDKDFYRYSNYKNNSTHSCTSHNINDIVLRELVLDNISEKITDDRFATLSLNYEREQKDLKEKINELSTTIDKTNQEELDLTTFIDKVKNILKSKN